MKRKNKITIIVTICILIFLLGYLLLYRRHGTIGEVYEEYFDKYEVSSIHYDNSRYYTNEQILEFHLREECFDDALAHILSLEITSAIPYLYDNRIPADDTIYLSGSSDNSALWIRVIDEKTIIVSVSDTAIPHLNKQQTYRLSGGIDLRSFLNYFEMELIDP